MTIGDRDKQLLFEWVEIHSRLSAEGHEGDELEQAAANEFLTNHTAEDYEGVLRMRAGVLDGYRAQTEPQNGNELLH